MIRTANLSDLRVMADWAAAEGWNPGQDDAEAFLAADPGGFFVSEVDGQLAACISVVNHAADYAFLGFYICAPEFRGQGIGYALWQHALAHAGDRTVGLDGVAAQEANYARSGFVRAGSTRRLVGRLDGPADGQAYQPNDLDHVLSLDKGATGIDRRAFLTAWVTGTDTRRTVVTDSGFATARLCRDGCKIGPVIAPDADSAVRLARGAARALGHEDIIIDVPDSQTAFDAALRARNFVETFATARMYRGPAPHGNGTEYAIATMELG